MAAKTIIIDHGSGFLKAGLSGWNQPQLIYPSVVSYTCCRENPGPSYAQRRVRLGIDLCDPCSFSHPIERGRVTDWEGVEHTWSFLLQHYRQEQGDCPVILSEFPLKEPATRKRTLEIMFELLGVSSLFLADELEMSLYASGLLNGIVVDSGYGLTRVQSYLLGQPLPTSRRMLEFAGQDLSTYLLRSLFKEKCNEHDLFQVDTVTETQISKCYVPINLEEALDFHQSLPCGSDKGSTYQLPDGTRVELTPLQQLAPEMFFNPQVFGVQCPSISQVVADSIESCEAPMRPLLMSHVVACGGNSLFPGFTKRLCRELNSGSFPCKATVWMGEKRHISVWLGASVVAYFSTYRSQWMTRKEYLESMRL